MRWHEKIIAAHEAVTKAVSHGGRMKSDRYFVWQEDGANDLIAEGHTERAVSGFTDLFSKTELDPWSDEIGETFDAAGIAWELNSVQFEPDTGFWHWSWDWEVEDG